MHVDAFAPYQAIRKAISGYASVLVRTPTTSCMSILFALAAAAMGGVLAQDFWRLNVSTAAFVYARGNSTRFKLYNSQYFGPYPRMSTIIVTPRGNNGVTPAGAFDKRAFQVLYDIEDAVTTIQISRNGIKWSFPDFCQRLYGPASSCSELSATQFWPNSGFMQNDSAIGYTVGKCTSGNIPCQDSKGQPIEVAYNLGRGFTVDGGNVTSAPALFSTYSLNAVPEAEASGGEAGGKAEDEEYLAAAIAWEREWVSRVRRIAKTLDSEGSPFQIAYGAASSLEDEVSNEAHADVPIIALSYCIMSMYLVVALSTLQKPLLSTRILVATATVVGVLAALLLAGGIALASKVDLNPIVFQVLPFLLLAIGVDSVFQLLDAYQREQAKSWGEPMPSGIPMAVRNQVDRLAGLEGAAASAGAACCGTSSPTFCLPKQRGYRHRSRPQAGVVRKPTSAFYPAPIRESDSTRHAAHDAAVSIHSLEEFHAEAFGRAAMEAGQTIFISSLVQSLAFMAASFIPFEAMSAVCVYCSIGVAFNFVFFLLLTLPAVALDIQRQLGGRLEILCCEACGRGPRSSHTASRIANTTVRPSRLYQDLARIDAEEKGQGDSRGPQQTIPAADVENDFDNGSSSKFEAEEGTEVRACTAWVLSGPFSYLMSPSCKAVQYVIVLCFVGWWAWSATQLASVPVAFEQIDLLPSSSYMYKFLRAYDSFLGLGPPLQLVVNGSDLSQVEQRRSYEATSAALHASRATLEQPPFDAIGDAEWYTDYCSPVIAEKLPSNATFGQITKHFVSADCLDVCGLPPFASCQVFNETARCPASLNNLDSAECASPYGLCIAALCNIRGIHATNLRWTSDNKTIVASRLQTYMQPLESMDDYVGGMKAAWQIVGDARAGGHALASAANQLPNRTTAFDDSVEPLAPGAKEGVYSDSVYFEYYQQYVVLVGLAWRLFGYAGAALLALHTLYYLDVRQSLMLLVVVSGTMLSVAASLAWWGIGLNSTTVVNLIGTTGVVIELCVHLLSFVFNGAPKLLASRMAKHTGSRDSATVDLDRAVLLLAFVDGGATVLSGISTTKLLGLAILAVAPSRLTRVYFLRPFLAAVAFGTLHVLVFAPSALLCVADATKAVGSCCCGADASWSCLGPRRDGQGNSATKASKLVQANDVSRSVGYGALRDEQDPAFGSGQSMYVEVEASAVANEWDMK